MRRERKGVLYLQSNFGENFGSHVVCSMMRRSTSSLIDLSSSGRDLSQLRTFAVSCKKGKLLALSEKAVF